MCRLKIISARILIYTNAKLFEMRILSPHGVAILLFIQKSKKACECFSLKVYNLDNFDFSIFKYAFRICFYKNIHHTSQEVKFSWNESCMELWGEVYRSREAVWILSLSCWQMRFVKLSGLWYIRIWWKRRNGHKIWKLYWFCTGNMLI